MLESKRAEGEEHVRIGIKGRLGQIGRAKDECMVVDQDEFVVEELSSAVDEDRHLMLDQGSKGAVFIGLILGAFEVDGNRHPFFVGVDEALNNAGMGQGKCAYNDRLRGIFDQLEKTKKRFIFRFREGIEGKDL